jgi:hypothetical protein
MSPLIRWLFSLLLCVALPMQGFAASTLMLCGSNHSAMLAAQSGARVEQAQQGHEQHGHAMNAHHHAEAGDAHAAPAHHAPSDAASAGPADPTDSGHGFAMPDDTSSGKCSLCAACCGAVALAATPLLVTVEAASPVYGPALTERAVTRPLAGLERPPRFPLA